jgi:hypothetical protein
MAHRRGHLGHRLWRGNAAGSAAATGMTGATGACIGAWKAALPPLTMRTLPSASVISSSDTFDSDTRSIRVFSLRKSMGSPALDNVRLRNLPQIHSSFIYFGLFIVFFS